MTGWRLPLQILLGCSGRFLEVFYPERNLSFREALCVSAGARLYKRPEGEIIALLREGNGREGRAIRQKSVHSFRKLRKSSDGDNW